MFLYLISGGCQRCIPEASLSPGMNKTTQDSATNSADHSTPENASASSSLVKRKMGIAPAAAPQPTRRSLRSSNKLNTDEVGV